MSIQPRIKNHRHQASRFRVGPTTSVLWTAALLNCGTAHEPSDGASSDSGSGGFSAVSSGGSTIAASGGAGTSSGGAALGGTGALGSGGSTAGTGGEPDVDEPPSPITLWLAGDSTVANGPTPCPAGWGKFFAAEFNDLVTVVNSAVGGRSVRTWLYDVTDQKGADGECVLNEDGSGAPLIQARWSDMLSQMKQGDYLFVQFGINDGSSTCPRHVGGDAFEREYAMMARAAVERGVQPVFLTPVSAIKCSGSTAVGSRGFLTETFTVGDAEDVPVIDLHQLSIDLYQSSSFCPVPGGGASAATTGPVGDFFCDDHTHFSDSGAARIAALVAQAIEDSGMPLADYLAR